MPSLEPKFWESKPLDALNSDEWEALCDGCGWCCLHKLQCDETEEIYFTRVACRLLDIDKCRCEHYTQRLAKVPECVNILPGDSDTFSALPATCAYRLLSEGQSLPDWHYLISGSKQAVHQVGASVREFALREQDVDPDDYEDHILHWVDE